MTITTVLAYLLIACYFVMERSLRKGKQALKLKPGLADAGSSQLLWSSGMISILLVIAAPILNSYEVGYWSHANVGWLGLTLMLGGLAMRYWAAKTNTVHLRLRCAEDKENRRIGSGGGGSMSWLF
ncbi:MAG: hypothetical protein N4J56_001413 [Chroococcidiopsis sp. SAG 2025]|uniref:hypothetical protein n=1 Tax=Chroococcidiopsis sp. SAG 2025 TaxID=171389 RepID=UPI00293711F2|nr:hypothetical protein [Chroococcidiopsis sp. SAG 2025]MDV2991759.1 hypothetical protein [Chroococcidiopsis sp. SAG 2025]